MEKHSPPGARHVITDEDRFHILLKPLYGIVDPQSPLDTEPPQTPEEQRRAIDKRIARVKKVLKR
jgi:hypothetical protein